jgi:hypothetical protein
MKLSRMVSCILLVGVLFLSTVNGGMCATEPKIREMKPPHHVLILGNSFSFYNNGLHTFLRNLARERAAEGERFVFRIITTSGGYLEDASFGFEQALKRQYPWDAVVFQGNSNEPIDAKKKKAFQDNARQLAAQAKAANVPALFFATWAYTGKPEMTEPLLEAYTAIANETDSMVSPVGTAFAASLNARPDIVLLREDKLHPTEAGSYLAACTLYASMMKRSPEGLRYDAGLGAETAAFLQKTAWETAKRFYNW